MWVVPPVETMPSLDKDRVVVLHVRVFGNARACECLIFIFLHVSYCGWAEMNFLQVH